MLFSFLLSLRIALILENYLNAIIPFHYPTSMHRFIVRVVHLQRCQVEQSRSILNVCDCFVRCRQGSKCATITIKPILLSKCGSRCASQKKPLWDRSKTYSPKGFTFRDVQLMPYFHGKCHAKIIRLRTQVASSSQT